MGPWARRGRLNIDRCRVGTRSPSNLVLTHHALCRAQCVPGCPIGDLREQGVARHFYQSRNERPNNIHPTAKSIRLMRYLCRLITPRGAVVLDPFCGQGSTGIAALQERCRFVGIDRVRKYVDLSHESLEREGGVNTR